MFLCVEIKLDYFYLYFPSPVKTGNHGPRDDMHNTGLPCTMYSFFIVCLNIYTRIVVYYI